MSDLTERLRGCADDRPLPITMTTAPVALLREAADEIERLRAELRAILAVSERHNNATCNVISDVARRALAESSHE